MFCCLFILKIIPLINIQFQKDKNNKEKNIYLSIFYSITLKQIEFIKFINTNKLYVIFFNILDLCTVFVHTLISYLKSKNWKHFFILNTYYVHTCIHIKFR